MHLRASEASAVGRKQTVEMEEEHPSGWSDVRRAGTDLHARIRQRNFAGDPTIHACAAQHRSREKLGRSGWRRLSRGLRLPRLKGSEAQGGRKVENCCC